MALVSSIACFLWIIVRWVIEADWLEVMNVPTMVIIEWVKTVAISTVAIMFKVIEVRALWIIGVRTGSGMFSVGESFASVTGVGVIRAMTCQVTIRIEVRVIEGDGEWVINEDSTASKGRDRIRVTITTS